MTKRTSAYTAAVVLLCLLVFGTTSGQSIATKNDVRHISADSAVEMAFSDGGGAESARLRLHQSLLEAAELQRQHETGPPRHPLDPPSDFEEAKAKDLLPIQFTALQEMAKSAYIQEMAGFRAEVIGSYYAALLAEESKDVMDTAIETIKLHKDRAESLHAAGEVPEADVLRADARLESARADLASADSELERALLRLSAKIGLDMDEDLQLQGDLEMPHDVELSLEDNILQARKLDPGVIAARGELAAAEKEKALFIEHRGAYSQRRSYRKRSLAVDEAEHDLAMAESDIELQVRAAHSEISEAAARLDSAIRQVDAAERAGEMVALQYEAGLTTITEVLDATLEYRKARLGEVQASVGCLTALTHLEALLGDGVPDAQEKYEKVLTQIDQLR